MKAMSKDKKSFKHYTLSNIATKSKKSKKNHKKSKTSYTKSTDNQKSTHKGIYLTYKPFNVRILLQTICLRLILLINLKQYKNKARLTSKNKTEKI